MELDLLTLFLIFYLANISSRLTFMLINYVINFYKFRKMQKNLDFLKKSLESYVIDKNNGGGK